MKAILYKNGSEIKRGEYPRSDMALVEDLEIGLEWKLIVELDKPPHTNLENLIRNEASTHKKHPVYTHLKIVEVSYSAQRKSDTEISKLIEDKKRNANDSILFNDDKNELIILAIGALIMKVRGDENAKSKLLLDKVLSKALKVWKNNDTLRVKLQQIIDNGNLDINTEWTND